MRPILIIQTAFLGDAILATSLVGQVAAAYPGHPIYVLTRRGHESLFEFHPQVKKVLVWDKRGGFLKKYLAWWRVWRTLCALGSFEVIFNLQRFFSMGLLSVLTPAKLRVGFSQNPLSFAYSARKRFEIQTTNWDGSLKHEVQRNYELLQLVQPRLPYKVALDLRPQVFWNPETERSLEIPPASYVALAPASVWETKQWPEEMWIKLLEQLAIHPDYLGTHFYLLGGPGDVSKCERIQGALSQQVKDRVKIVAGKWSLLESFIFLKSAKILIANDSAPIHMASAVNTPTWAIFCSTLPQFGFYPLADFSQVREVLNLPCRPCGIHGKKACPLGHFKCALDINVESFLTKN